MAEITITVDARAVQQLLDRAPQALETAIRGSLEDSSTLFRATMQRYPAPPPNSSYRRTGTLGRSWSVKPITRTSSGWSVAIGSNGNMAPYNRAVQKRSEQAAIHRHRWLTAESATEQSSSQIQRFVDARIRAAMAGLG